jgi:hypothetical protein
MSVFELQPLLSSQYAACLFSDICPRQCSMGIRPSGVAVVEPELVQSFSRHAAQLQILCYFITVLLSKTI